MTAVRSMFPLKYAALTHPWWLRRSIVFGVMSLPIPTRLAKSRVHAFAESVASRLDFTRRDAIESVVAQLGGAIEYRTADLSSDRLPESIIVRFWNDFTIYLPSVTSPSRDRFTIAHELGHLFLHYPLAHDQSPNESMIATRWVDESNESLQRAEWEANWFAAAFLMPAADFVEVYNRSLKNIELTANEFKVSIQTTEIRARNLSLI